MAKIRTRFAPSPTGKMHMGNLRSALYEYLVAKHEGGDFILRIEDTDRGRFVEGATDIIYKTLAGVGLVHDEGPDKDGGCGPYIQSERVKSGLYMKYALELVEKGEAYYCFCDKERLESLTTTIGEESVTHYDKHCLHLSKEEIDANLKAGKPFVIRQNIPTSGTTSFSDENYGVITVENSELDDQILIKSDGFPTYNFANVVDDHLMGITHVVRGNEYLSSTPKYTLLYKAFGWEEPKYIHLPLITNEDHKKLSKRSGQTVTLEGFIEQGFVPEALLNYVALLGWNSPDNREILSLEEITKEFDYHRISKSPAVFDNVKLRWMNGEYLKAMDEDKYLALAVPYVEKTLGTGFDSKAIALLVKTRIETLCDIPEMIDFFGELPEYDVEMYIHKKMKTTYENSLESLTDLLPRLKALPDLSLESLQGCVAAYVEEKQIKNGVALWPLRTAVSGKQTTPGGAYEIIEILGAEESFKRIEKGIEKLKAAIAQQ
ncbi:MAG: glutamate--tRNA ligase [Lachnospiraceae bacterium]|nr:glutamate--tRNA ligase [Lachnospiraceae bacterium]